MKTSLHLLRLNTFLYQVIIYTIIDIKGGREDMQNNKWKTSCIVGIVNGMIELIINQ